MTSPNPVRQKVALKTIEDLFVNSANVWVIHYSCESFHDRPQGRSPRITSIALRKLDSAQTSSFSIHQMAERKGIPFQEIREHYDILEKEMLAAYFSHLASYKGVRYMHWNMRDINYGFQAIEHKYRVLGETPYIIEDSDKFDLSRLLIDIFGVGYIGHPRMGKLIEKNHITKLNFLTGKEEAEAFEKQEFVALHQSTLRKVDVLCNIAARVRDGGIKTNATWWEMRDGSIRTFGNWITAHWFFSLVVGLASIFGLAYAIFDGW